MGSDQYQYKELRRWEYFENTRAHLKLFAWAFGNGNGVINICVARLGIPLILRNLFTRNKTLVVWHYYDAYDGKSKFLRKWYLGLAQLAAWIPGNKLAFVCVAPFWESYFKDLFKLKQVFLFPNFFDPIAYAGVPKLPKKKQIHLGQVSNKNSNELFLIAEKLTALGYQCYFSTNDAEKVYSNPAYEVRYFEKREQYLQEMSASEYTLAMPFFREGWNRVAHESLLMGTQVIGFDKGGLGNLLKGANAFIVGNAEMEGAPEEYYRNQLKEAPRNVIKETIDIIVNARQQPIDYGFLRQYEVEQTGTYLVPIIDWCRTE